MESSISVSRKPRGEGMLAKARRLVDEEAFTQLTLNTFHCRGDSGNHFLAIITPTDEYGNPRSRLVCSCRAGNWGGCSHRMGLGLWMSQPPEAV